MRLLQILGILTILLSCRKKEIPPPPVPVKPMDTVFPGRYIPAWPGSWWTYGQGGVSTTTVTTSQTFVKDVYKNQDSAYVPVYGDYPLWKESCHWGLGYYEEMARIMNEDAAVGSEWHLSGAGQSGHMVYYLKMLAKDTAMAVEDTSYAPVIVLEKWGHQGGVGPKIRFQRLYYARDVGLVREEEIHAQKDSVLSYKNLQAFFINH